MEYIDARKILEEIEKKYDVMKIKYKGVPVWLFLRCYLIAHMYSDRPSNTKSINKLNVKAVIGNLFCYPVINLFKKNRIWIYDGVITRKKVGEKYYHHVTGAITELVHDSLLLESPERVKKHYRMTEIPEKRIISNAWSILIARGLIPFIGRIKIENGDLLEEIISEYKIKFDYNYYIKFFLAQRKTVDFLLRIAPNPKVVFMVNAYNQMGYVWSFHNHNIPVVEMQHGVINKGHFAYNSFFHNDVLHPDEICVYGEVEFNYFTIEQKNYCNKVTMTGLYLLDCSDKEFNTDIFSEYRKQYQKIVVLAGQTGYEELLMDFTEKLAIRQPSYLFIYIPRRHVDSSLLRQSNIIYKEGVNIYEYLKWCDIHSTISSTTCLEAHYFKKPIVFYVTKNSVAMDYYGGILGNENGAFYVNTTEDFIKVAEKLGNTAYSYRELFAHHSVENMKKVICRYLKE